MQGFLGIFMALLANMQCAWAELVLDATFPAVIRNEEPTVVALTLTGDLANAVVTEVRTVLQTPGKRRPKPYANFTHAAPEGTEDSHAALLNLRPVYSLPTKTYLLSYSVLVDNGEEAQWVDSEATEVKIEDPDVSNAKFSVALLVLVAAVSSLFYASLYMTNPGWWESVLPRQLHGIIPKPAKKRA